MAFQQAALLTAVAVALTSCDPAVTFHFPECYHGGDPLAGRFVPGLDTCIVAAELPQACESVVDWWSGPGCPDFQTYVQGERPVPSPNGNSTETWGARDPSDRFTVLGCGSYDVVEFNDQLSMDRTEIRRAVFDAAGAMAWLMYTDSQFDATICCVPDQESGYSRAWGTPVGEDCTNPKVYTPADFPELDTGP